MPRLHADRLNGLAATLSTILFLVLLLMGIACIAIPTYAVAAMGLDANWFWLIVPSGIFFACSFGLIDNISSNSGI